MDLHHIHHPFSQAGNTQEIYADLKKTQSGLEKTKSDLAAVTNKHMATVAKHAADLERWTQKHQKVQAELEEYRQANRALKARNEELAAKGLAYKNKHAELEAEVKSLRKGKSSDKTVEALQDSMAKLKTHATRVECQHAALSEQIESFRAAKKQHDAAISQLNTKYENLKAAKSQADVVNSRLNETIASLKAQKQGQPDASQHQLLKHIDKVIAVCAEYHAQSQSPLSEMLTTTRQNIAKAVRA
jgi:chromosome segregation ATPase